MSQREVTGTITPAGAIGIYDQIDDLNGKSRWKHQTHDWWILYSGGLYLISNGTNMWYRVSESELGEYPNNIESTGVATVSVYSAVSIPIAMHHYKQIAES